MPMRIPVLIVCWPLMCVGGVRAGVIEEITALPTADSLGIQVRLRSTRALPGVTVRAEIRPSDGGAALWQGVVGSADLAPAMTTMLERRVSGLRPRLWSPGSPALYDLVVTADRGGSRLDTQIVRTGFRSVESRDGRILLNGRPIFLRGLAINPPGRGIPEATGFAPEFARQYVRYLRSQNFNCMRMNLDFVADPKAQVWFDACDELGMLVYQGCYGSPPTGRSGDRRSKDEPPDDLDACLAAYREVFETYARHPSVIIYILANELPYAGPRGRAWHEFLAAACARLKEWDATRLYIGNGGYGEGREGDINDVHRYWGWYYNTFLTYYNLRRAHEIYGEKGAVQPFTFSECVGAFTSTLGEFNLVFAKQLGAQLHWTGHSPDQAGDALAYQAFLAQRACESFRTLREVNPRLAGLMPFTILFYHWNGITRFDQMKPKPVAEAMTLAYQPILLAWESWTPHVYAGTRIEPQAHIVNDAEDFCDLRNARLGFQLLDPRGRIVAAGEKELPRVEYFGHAKVRVPIAIPADAPTGRYTLAGTIAREGKAVSRNQTSLFVAGPDWRASLPRQAGELPLYDPAGSTARALATLGIRTRPVTDLSMPPSDGRLIIGEDAAPERDMRAFVRAGGRILLLGQDARRFDPSWLPARIEMLTGTANDPAYLDRKRPTADQMYINLERPDHPVFAGLDRRHFRLWSDYTGWEQTQPGFPAVYPVTRGFRLTRAEDLARVAVLANYDRGLEGVAVCEMFEGRGSIVFTGLDLVRRVGLDPVADRVLGNLVAYLRADDHPLHPVIDQPIRWGRYATEKGLITGPLNGLVVNCRWVPPPTDPDARPLPDNTGAWNMRPGDQFVPFGRRPIGPYTYNAGTAVVEPDKASRTGSGLFHAALPPGRSAMITKVENPSREEAVLEVEVNGRRESHRISAGRMATLRTELPGSPRTVFVRYTGHKCLVLVETAFE